MTDPGSTASATSRGPRPGARRPIKPAPAWLSLAALVLGLGAGIALRGSTAGWVPEAARALSRVGMLWARGLSLLVLPLIVALAMAAALDTPGMGRLGRRAVTVFLAMLGGGALLTVAIGLPLASLLRTDPAAAAALRAGVPVPAAAATSAGSGAAGVLLPSSVGAVLRGAMVLLLLLGAVLLGLALRRLVRGGRD